jgi:DNA-binding NarL/FixJ family response regulator
MAESAAPTRILILDPNPGFVDAAARFVERLPGCARAAADVALVDLGLAGLDLARRLKAGNPALDVIVMALFPTPELVAEARRAGVAAVIAKETFADELPGALARLRGAA